jgi:hypothetical protein
MYITSLEAISRISFREIFAGFYIQARRFSQLIPTAYGLEKQRSMDGKDAESAKGILEMASHLSRKIQCAEEPSRRHDFFGSFFI